MKKTLLIFGLLLMFQFAIGQEVITDFLYKDGDKNSSPSDFVEFNQKLYFEATSEGFGKEIWVTNGIENESYLLKDINPGENSGIQTSFSEASAIINNTLYFIAKDGVSDGEIWKTDGTREGTVKVTNFINSNINKLTLIGENFFFLTKNNDSLQVWISDGTATGTKVVKGNLPIWNSPTFQGKCNSNFIFTFQPEGTNDSRVWRSDGTSDGTFPITGEIDGNGAGPGGTSALTQYIEYNKELYFVSRYYLHKTDGTVENTQAITTLHAASNRLIDYAGVIEANGKLYFSFFEADYNRLFIWEFDGKNSQKIYDVSGSRYFMTSNLLARGNSLILCGINNTGGTSLIDLSLTDYSVSHIKELEDTSETPFIFQERFDLCNLQIINEDIIFCSTPLDRYQRKGWISGLTEATTNNIEDLDGVRTIFNFAGAMYFSKSTDLEGTELWRSDTNHQNFYLLDNINKSKYGMSSQQLMALNSNLIFSANDGELGYELWMYNNTTNLLKDIRKGSFGSYPASFVEFNNEIYFAANDSIHGTELWKTNGTEQGTTLVHDIVEGTSYSAPRHLTPYKGELFFVVYKNGNYHLCKTNGTDIEFITDFGVNEYGSPFHVDEMKSSGNHLYFITSGFGEDLWISDGTTSGTNKIKDFYSCNDLTAVNGHLFFTAYELYGDDVELWYSDGTETNTRLVKNIGLGFSSEPKDLISFNGLLFFTAKSKESGRELWKSDGTEAGTIQVADINPGVQNSFSDANFCILNGKLFFNSINHGTGFELWKTDGTDLGTEMVIDLNPGAGSSFPSKLVSIDDHIYFNAYDVDHGSELWKTDGTAPGTSMVADLVPGNLSSSPSSITSVNDEVFFIAETTDLGRQIWKISDHTITHIPDAFNETDITVYPNPSYDIIHFKDDLSNGNIEIYNANGQLISIKKIVNNSINISQLHSGLYIVRFNKDGKTISKKIIKI